MTEIIEGVKVELACRGMFFEGIKELEAHGNALSGITLGRAGVDLENAELQRLLSEASSSWSSIFRGLALERARRWRRSCALVCC